jgi:phospholipid:diacylglycerol acyltransferase
MLPRGGAAVWGDKELGSPDDAPDDERLNYFLQIRNAGAPRHEGINHTIDSALDFLFATMQAKNPHNVAEFSHMTHPTMQQQLSLNDPSLASKVASDFGNALTRPLPYAPSMKVFCLYGTGKASERAYVYEYHAADALRPFQLDVQYHARGIQNGVREVHGDGTITLASLGYVCRSVWRTSKKLNPAAVPVVTREYAHVAHQSVTPLQGRAEGDHVNIMGNDDMIEDILAIVSGHHDQVTDRIESELDALSAEIARRRALHKPRDAANHSDANAPS